MCIQLHFASGRLSAVTVILIRMNGWGREKRTFADARNAVGKLCRTFFKQIFEPLQSARALLRHRLLDKRANDQSPES